jgi:hypothetical protein
MAEVQLEERRSVQLSETVQLAEGEAQVVVNLPEPVPAGKVLDIRIEISGNYRDAEPQP